MKVISGKYNGYVINNLYEKINWGEVTTYYQNDFHAILKANGWFEFEANDDKTWINWINSLKINVRKDLFDLLLNPKFS